MWKKILLKIEVISGQTIDWVSSFLETKIFSIEKNVVTLGALLGGILLLFLGQYIIRKFSHQLEKRILSQLDIEPAVRHSMRTFIFYVLLILLVLLVLQLLHIPLTAITIVGGGLAVAIGLGAQSIVYDFLSGLIIILEHPIRQGDVVELENVRGHVEHIGARATRVHTVDNKHLVIPNNFFLSKVVLNWTLSDEMIRSDFAVGVTYDSPVKKVKDLIKEVVEAHKRVKKHPEPIILLSDFGNNAIVFRVYFWAKIASLMDMKKIESDLRFQIAEIFEKNHIVIAFPQRDLHIKSSKSPLQIELLPQTSQKNQPTTPIK